MDAVARFSILKFLQAVWMPYFRDFDKFGLIHEIRFGDTHCVRIHDYSDVLGSTVPTLELSEVVAL